MNRVQILQFLDGVQFFFEVGNLVLLLAQGVRGFMQFMFVEDLLRELGYDFMVEYLL